jgi:hypothetical protein
MAKYYLDIENDYMGKQKTMPMNIRGTAINGDYEEARVLQVANMNDGGAVTIKIAVQAGALSDEDFITAKKRDGTDMVFTENDNIALDTMQALLKAEYEGDVEEADNTIRVIFA